MVLNPIPGALGSHLLEVNVSDTNVTGFGIAVLARRCRGLRRLSAVSIDMADQAIPALST